MPVDSRDLTLGVHYEWPVSQSVTSMGTTEVHRIPTANAFNSLGSQLKPTSRQQCGCSISALPTAKEATTTATEAQVTSAVMTQRLKPSVGTTLWPIKQVFQKQKSKLNRWRSVMGKLSSDLKKTTSSKSIRAAEPTSCKPSHVCMM